MLNLKPAFWSRPELRLGLFGLTAVAAVYFGFIGWAPETGGMLVKRFGYYVLGLTFGLWLVALWQLSQQCRGALGLSSRERWGAGLALGFFTLLAFNAEPFRSKVLFDEFVLQSTAFNMHYFRDTATMVRGYDILGVFVSTDNYLDKRPNFYPFLVSLVHDFTGYRTANAYWLNAALLPMTLGLAYYQGRRLAGPWGAWLVLLLLGSLPLLGQNATGSGMELLNFFMILAVIALGGAYLRQPDHVRLSALVFGTLLLAQSRYESAVYVLPVAVLIGLGWWRRGTVIISWPTVLAPLLLVPCALQNKVLNNTRWMWELKADQETRFSLDYLNKNWAGAIDFLFSTSQRYANSLTLSWLGCAALVGLIGYSLRPRAALRPLAEDQLALVWLGLGVIGNTGLTFFYYWASFNDPMASRLSLPLHLVFAFAVVGAGGLLARRWSGVRTILIGLACLAVVTATSRFAQPLYSHTGIDEIEWEKRFVLARPPGDRLILTNKSTLPWLLLKIPSILVGRGQLMAERLQYNLAAGTFQEVLVMQTFRPTTAEGDHQLPLADQLPKNFTLEFLAERRFGTRITRISRLVAVELPVSPSEAAGSKKSASAL